MLPVVTWYATGTLLWMGRPIDVSDRSSAMPSLVAIVNGAAVEMSDAPGLVLGPPGE